MAILIEFVVPGVPATGGSKRYLGQRNGRAIIVDNDKRNRSWRDAVACEAARAMKGRAPLVGAVRVCINFSMPRPKSHYSSAKQGEKLKPSAPEHHSKRPDIDKLSRAVMDALTGVVWRDDAQVCRKSAEKTYSDQPGARIVIQALDSQPSQG